MAFCDDMGITTRPRRAIPGATGNAYDRLEWGKSRRLRNGTPPLRRRSLDRTHLGKR